MPEITDAEYLNMEFTQPRGGDGPRVARVKKRMKGGKNKPIGIANDNPILNTRMFEVEFLDSSTVAMLVNSITENLLVQVDSDGYWQMILDKVIDSRAIKAAV